MEKKTFSRREFVKNSVIGAAGALTIPSFITACSGNKGKLDLDSVVVPELPDKAVDGRPLRAGLVGCGGRGTGAACDFVSAGNGLTITALGDIFPDKMESCRENLKKQGIEVPDDKCFIGFDAYKKVIDSDIDVVLLCTPPVFRPEHFEYAISKGKHCFIEKPCGVDPVGAKRILATGKQAKAKGLSVMSGTIRRSQKDCVETYRRVRAGAIGDIVSAHVTRFGGSLWFKKRQPGWSDMEYMLRNWSNFCWTSGDFIVEQFIHEIDQLCWFIGDPHPTLAMATGGRSRRITGDMYDFISVEYVFDPAIHANCTSRQISGCDNQKDILVFGTKGYTDCAGKIYNLDGSVMWSYPYPEEGAEDQSNAVPDPYREEHVRLVNAIRKNEPVNDTENHVRSTLMAIMGRESAYSGKFVTWDEIMASELKLGPEKFEFGPVEGIKEEIPLSGTAPVE